MKDTGMMGLGRVVLANWERPILLEQFGKRKEDEYFAEIPDVRLERQPWRPAVNNGRERIIVSQSSKFEALLPEKNYV
jgi:non-homologous end joining protein Ku